MFSRLKLASYGERFNACFVVHFNDLVDFYSTQPPHFFLDFGFVVFFMCFFTVFVNTQLEPFATMFSMAVRKYAFARGFRGSGVLLDVFSRLFWLLAGWAGWLAGLAAFFLRNVSRISHSLV